MKIKTAMNITKKTKIRHRNELNQTLAQLPLSAKRVMYMALAPIDSKKPLDRGQTFRVRADDLAAIANITPSVAYQQLKDGAKILGGSSLSLTGDDVVALAKDLELPYNQKHKPNEMDLYITDYCVYFKNEGYLELRFTRAIEPYISSLIGKKNKFTTQLLTSSLRLSGQYSSALYQLIRKNYSNFKKKNSFVISVDALKEELIAYTFNENGDIEYKYPEFPIFKRDVLNKSILEIKKKTEVSFIGISVSEKIGRKVSKLQFEFIVEEDELSGDEGGSSMELSEEDATFLEEFDKKVPPKKK